MRGTAEALRHRGTRHEALKKNEVQMSPEPLAARRSPAPASCGLLLRPSACVRAACTWLLAAWPMMADGRWEEELCPLSIGVTDGPAMAMLCELRTVGAGVLRARSPPLQRASDVRRAPAPPAHRVVPGRNEHGAPASKCGAKANAVPTQRQRLLGPRPRSHRSHRSGRAGERRSRS
jgi:hypothetical protein